MIAIVDVCNQDIGLKLLFGDDADYFIIKPDIEVLQESRTRSYTKYGFQPYSDMSQIVSSKYNILCIICVFKEITPDTIDVLDRILDGNQFDRVCLFDNADYDYDPLNYYDRSAITHIFKRNYSKLRTYDSRVHPFPFIMFGHESLIEKCIEIPHNPPLSVPETRVFFSGGLFNHVDDENQVYRNRQQKFVEIARFLTCPHGLIPYADYLCEIAASKYAVDIQGVGEPNKRTFEILLSNTLALTERNDLVWPFPEPMYTEHTLYSSGDGGAEFERKLQALETEPGLYDMCMKRQQRIVRQYLNPSWIRGYLWSVLCPSSSLELGYRRVRILMVDQYIHHKNRAAIFSYPNIRIDTVGSVEQIYQMSGHLWKYDAVYSPALVIDVSRFPPNQRFIFGPHFSVLPEERLMAPIRSDIRTGFVRSVFIVPSQWTVDIWQKYLPHETTPVCMIPFAVDTTRFTRLQLEPTPSGTLDKVMVYFKARNPADLELVTGLLDYNGITNYRIFGYTARYDEQEYLQWLQVSKYGIIVDAHESQGFAIQEALSCNVPLLVWSTRWLNDEYGSNYPKLAVTTVPYWDSRCGEVFYDAGDIMTTFDKFLTNVANGVYRPREYVLENLSVVTCEQKWMDLLTRWV